MAHYAKIENNLKRIAIEPELNNALHNFWIFKNELDANTCKKIINLGSKKWIDATVKATGQDIVNLNERKTNVFFSNDSWLFDIASSYMKKANENSNWNFEISAAETMQVTKYKKGDYYNFHYDGNGFTKIDTPKNKLTHGKTRKLSMTIILNEDYEGGEFEFFSHPDLIKEKKGTIIVFPSYMEHRVRPITKGTRYSLVVWFVGEPFK